jgi:hypothetical protein
LSLGDAFVDADRFEALLHTAAQAPPAQALLLLDEALGLWAGRAFGDLADEDWCRPAAVRLEELRLVALEARSQARLDVGADAEAVPELITAAPMGQDPRILDAATGGDVSGPFPGVFYLSFAPAGETALAVGDEVAILDARSGRVSKMLSGHGGFYAAVFVREGRWISAITGSALDELIDVESGTRIGVPLGVGGDPTAGGYATVIVANGLYYGPPDGPVVYYDFDPASWEATACRSAGRNLTRAEWDRYLATLGEYRATCPQYPAAA